MRWNEEGLGSHVEKFGFYPENNEKPKLSVLTGDKHVSSDVSIHSLYSHSNVRN